MIPVWSIADANDGSLAFTLLIRNALVVLFIKVYGGLYNGRKVRIKMWRRILILLARPRVLEHRSITAAQHKRYPHPEGAE